MNQPTAQNYTNYMALLWPSIRSLRVNHDDLQILTETFSQKLDVITLTETWIAKHENADEYNIEDYQPIFSNPRKNV